MCKMNSCILSNVYILSKCCITSLTIFTRKYICVIKQNLLIFFTVYTRIMKQNLTFTNYYAVYYVNKLYLIININYI